MKPIYHVLLINLSLFGIISLLFLVVFNRPEVIPIFTGIQAAFNMVGMGLFFVGKNRAIAFAFLLAMVVCAGITVAGYYWVHEWSKTVKVDEHYTS